MNIIKKLFASRQGKGYERPKPIRLLEGIEFELKPCMSLPKGDWLMRRETRKRCKWTGGCTIDNLTFTVKVHDWRSIATSFLPRNDERVFVTLLPE